MFYMENDQIRFALSKRAEIVQFQNKVTGHDYIAQARGCWKLIFRDGVSDENAVWPKGQTPQIAMAGEAITVTYRQLCHRDRFLEIGLRLRFELSGDEVTAWAEIDNDQDVEIAELHFPIVGGIVSLAGDPAEDTLVWPHGLGKRIAAPLHADLGELTSFRGYEAPDQHHRNLYLLYPGPASMQWYELCNEQEGLYMASYDISQQTTCLNVEKDMEQETLSLSFVKLPFLKKGENWRSSAFVVSAHAGDWHVGARKYRSWAEDTWWSAPVSPAWVKDFKGWLRVILKHQYGEILRDYAKLPALHREAQASGMDTVFILGWIPGGFSRKWPEYYPDPAMGGEEGLKAAIDEIHTAGGKVLVFVSYYVVDRDTDFYREVGHRISLKNVWDVEYSFAETYSGEGVWRRVASGRMPLACMCPSTPEWQDQMLDVGRRIVEMGADGVLYDIGGYAPVLCFDSSHPHDKPNTAYATKAENYRQLRANVKTLNSEAAMCMEHTVDIYGQHMDIAHSLDGAWPDLHAFPALYRYTFPEHICMNRECGEDEDDYLTKANYTFIYGLRYDMTIFRCRGTLSDIPHYAAYLGKLNRIRDDHGDLLLEGTYVDDEGFELDNPSIVAKSYKAAGRLAIVAWNPSSERQPLRILAPGYRLIKVVTVEGEADESPEILNSNHIAVLIYVST